MRVVLVKYELVDRGVDDGGGDDGSGDCCGVGNGDQQNDHLIALDQSFR